MDSKELRENIISHLTKKGNYEPDVDDMTIDKLISNIEIAASCLKDITDNGVVEEYEYKPGHVITRPRPINNIYALYEGTLKRRKNTKKSLVTWYACLMTKLNTKYNDCRRSILEN